MTASAPFAPGSVSVGLYLPDLQPGRALAMLEEQAAAAVAVGFDGFTLAEHHAGFGGYLPNPVQAIGWLLGATPDGWGAPLPILLPLRSVPSCVEELAWLAARYPGRVGAGFAAGYLLGDFEALGVAFDDRFNSFWLKLADVASQLRGEGSGALAADPAVGLAVRSGLPLVAAATGPSSIRRAGRLGLGLLPAEMDDERCHEMFADYTAAGGRGPRIINRWCWLGDPPAGPAEAWRRQYDKPGDVSWQREEKASFLLSAPEPEALAARLALALATAGADSLSIRFHMPGIEAGTVLEQIRAFGERVLPPLRSLTTGRGSGSP
jgi:alkanesulfonate monooxygenase SsuD/methylene tetrahydromethanopterin reductase-like flavin-dependent oxidoreductase (luciferase family)